MLVANISMLFSLLLDTQILFGKPPNIVKQVNQEGKIDMKIDDKRKLHKLKAIFHFNIC